MKPRHKQQPSFNTTMKESYLKATGEEIQFGDQERVGIQTLQALHTLQTDIRLLVWGRGVVISNNIKATNHKKDYKLILKLHLTHQCFKGTMPDLKEPHSKPQQLPTKQTNFYATSCQSRTFLIVFSPSPEKGRESRI